MNYKKHTETIVIHTKFNLINNLNLKNLILIRNNTRYAVLNYCYYHSKNIYKINVFFLLYNNFNNQIFQKMNKSINNKIIIIDIA